jgi:CheY-like chemotaxis protein
VPIEATATRDDFSDAQQAPPLDDGLAELKSLFLASLNHEIRTPLSGIVGLMSLLAETELDQEQSEYVAAAQKCAAQLMETLNLVLDYSALASGHRPLTKSEFSPERILETVAADALIRSREKGLQFLYHIEDELPETAVGDPLALREILTQLLRNAVKFTSSGQVQLRAKSLRADPLSIRLVVEVSDTGQGIPPAKLESIFQAFQQGSSGLGRSHTGLGLGLALSHLLCAKMHGEITVSSELGKGSRFTVSLPFWLPVVHREESAVKTANLDYSAGKPRILFVDDNSVARQVVAHSLTRAGYAVECAASAEEGLAVAAATRFDLILMDLQMPGTDGLTAARMIRELQGYDEIPILALSANYSEEAKVESLRAGMQGFLAKPIERAELVAAIREFLP